MSGVTPQAVPGLTPRPYHLDLAEPCSLGQRGLEGGHLLAV